MTGHGRPVFEGLAVGSAVVLAGGSGRRMGGRDKSRLMLCGAPLSDHLARSLVPQARSLALVAPVGQSPLIPANCLRLNDLSDRSGNPIGPLGGLAAAGVWAQKHLSRNDWVISAPVDCPLFPKDFAARALGAVGKVGGKTEIVIGTFQGRPYPVCGLWRVKALAAIADYLSPEIRDFSVRGYLATRKVRNVEFSAWYDFNPFAGANTTLELGLIAAHLAKTTKTD